MHESLLQRAPRRAVLLTTAWALAVLAATSVHHIYGAALFATPWRLHIVYISVPVAIAIVGAMALGRSAAAPIVRGAASALYVALTGVFAVGMIGFYEGGYNHLLPNIQYALGIEHTLREGLYEPPDDLFFQLTGIAQFAIALVAGWRLAMLLRPRSPPGA